MLAEEVLGELHDLLGVHQRRALLRRLDAPHAIVLEQARGQRPFRVMHPDQVIRIVRAVQRRLEFAGCMAVENGFDDGARLHDHLVAVLDRRRNRHAGLIALMLAIEPARSPRLNSSL